ncbi:hypothetical protein cyc_05870 [Cyclospora cayetanensis]|uniref:Uncharacterized protein n=1 Tax=Cyclospora cayetanensis TaxID=88456 RepID=A0A1D3DAN7_9EIME|nr:hypothetical protein cyc_05870 [Cyclospora cayetanensis]
MWHGGQTPWGQQTLGQVPPVYVGGNPRWEELPPRGGGPRRPSGGFRGGRGGGRGGSLRRHFDSLENLPVPPGALSDPWELLNAKHGGEKPPSVPTEDMVLELQREVARQIRMQQIQRQTADVQGKEVSGEVDGHVAQRELQGHPRDSGEAPCSSAGVTAALSKGEASGSEAPSFEPKRRPLVLPPPSASNFAAEGTFEDSGGSSSLAASLTDTSRISVGGPGSTGKKILLPAVTGASPDSCTTACILSLDDENIKKRIRLGSGASGEGV